MRVISIYFRLLRTAEIKQAMSSFHVKIASDTYVIIAMRYALFLLPSRTFLFHRLAPTPYSCILDDFRRMFRTLTRMRSPPGFSAQDEQTSFF